MRFVGYDFINFHAIEYEISTLEVVILMNSLMASPFCANTKALRAVLWIFTDQTIAISIPKSVATLTQL